MEADISNDVARMDDDVVGGHMSLVFGVFRGQMGPFMGDTCHHSHGDMWQ